MGTIELGLQYIKNEATHMGRIVGDIGRGERSVVGGVGAILHGMIDNLSFADKKMGGDQVVFGIQYQLRSGRFWHDNFGFVDQCIAKDTDEGKLDYAQTLASQNFFAKADSFAQTVNYCGQTGGPCGGFIDIKTRQGDRVDLQTVHIELTKDDFGQLLQWLQDRYGVTPVKVVDGSVLGQQLQIDNQDQAIGVKDIYDGLQAVLPEDRKEELVDYFRKLEAIVETGKVNQVDLVEPGQFNSGVIWQRIDLGVMSGGAGIGVGYVHLGSGHEEVSVTEVPVYSLPVVVADAQPHPRGGVVGSVTKELKSVISVKVVPLEVTVTELPRYEEIEDTVSHLRGVIVAGDEDMEMAEELVGKHNFREYKSVKGVKVWDTEVITENLPVGGQVEVTESTEKVVVPQVMRLVPVGDEIRVAALHPVADRQVVEYQERKSVESVKVGDIEEVITGSTEVTEGTEKVVVPTVTRMIPVNEMVSVIKEVSGVSDTEPIGEVITENTEGIQKAQKRKFSDFSFNSVSSVIKEAFDKKLAERKSVKSVKEKIAWLQRQVANILADQLMGRNTDGPVLGWLVHGWAMMHFDGIEEKQKMKRFSLSPVRIWADRVTGVARRVKDKFVRTYFSVYKQLFAAI